MKAKEIDKIGGGLILWQENLVGVSKAVVSRVSKVCNGFQMPISLKNVYLHFRV